MKGFKNFLVVTKNGLGKVVDWGTKVVAVSYIVGVGVCLIYDGICRREHTNRNNK